MMKKIIFQLLVLLLLFPCAVSAQEEPVDALSQEEQDQAPQQFEGFNLVGYTDGGTKSWDVKGDTADIKGNKVELTNVDANAYGEDPINVTAKVGTIDQKSGHMHLERDVVITSEGGAQLLTDSIDWERKEDLVTTNEKVTLQDDGIRAVGQGARAHPSLKTAQLNKDVTVKIHEDMGSGESVQTDLDDASKVITITCDGPMEIDQATQIAIFRDNVVAIQEGRKLTADRMEVYFDETNNMITKLISIGNVTITQGENRSFSDRAVYDAVTKKFTMSGRPKLILYTEDDDGLSALGN